MSQGKVKSLAKMFAGFPSSTYSVGKIQETISVYLEVLEIYSDDQVEAACQRLSREAREFPPSRGEVRAACEKFVLATTPRRDRLADHSRASDSLTEEQRQANIQKFNELLSELRGNMRNAPSAPKSFGTSRPAPYKMGAPLINSLVEKGLMKTKTEELIEEDDDAPAF